MIKEKFSILLVVLALGFLISCEDDLTKTNINPNGVSPETANANLVVPNVIHSFTREYSNLGQSNAAGVAQHMQEDSHYTSYNQHQWGPMDWTHLYNQLRNNDFVMTKALEDDQELLQGIALTMKSLIFGHITDLWGDAPYSEALRARDTDPILTPAFDSQEDIYRGILSDLQSAVTLFESGNGLGNPGQADLFFGGDSVKWHQFANSLILRYSMRLSEKLPDLASDLIGSVYASGVYLHTAEDDVSIAFNEADAWHTAAIGTDPTDFRRRKFGNPLIDRLVNYNDPRLEVWVAPVHVQWVEDTSLPESAPVDPTIRRNGEITTITSLTDEQFLEEIAAGNTFTRHFNPNYSEIQYDTRKYVGVIPGMIAPDTHNGNPTPGQQVQNQHVSQMADIFRLRNHDLLKSRIISAAEVSFILAEAAQRNWIGANAEDLYNNGVQQALIMWGVGDQFGSYITTPGVAYNGTLEQLIEQKWIASFTMATEAWFDYRRTGYPELVAGQIVAEPVIPLRYMYGNNELNNNEENVRNAIDRLETTQYSTTGANSSWSKSWLFQNTNNPW